MKKKKPITITLSFEIDKEIFELAQEQERSYSQMCEILIREGLLRFSTKDKKN
jgi:hypothetical protein